MTAESSIELSALLSPESQRIVELEAMEKSLRLSLEVARTREKRYALALEEFGINVNMIEMENGNGAFNNSIKERKNSILDCPLDSNHSFFHSLFDRGGWLCGLLVFQSCSSFILASNQDLISDHPAIVFFLTMLVGAGGNAGNQAAVRVIRGIAIGALNEHTTSQFIIRELIMAFALSSMLGLAGLLRALLSGQTTLPETIAITLTLMIIVFISIITGALLPLLLQQCRLDPAHSSTSIQVIMDISGVRHWTYFRLSPPRFPLLPSHLLSSTHLR